MSAPIELLKQVPMFEHLSDKELKTLAANFTERSFQTGQELTSEGQGAAGFFVIETGEANVAVDGDLRRTLGPGDYFGEIALIDGGSGPPPSPQRATGSATGLTPWQFRPLVEEHGTIAWTLLEALAAKIRELEHSKN